MRVGLSKAYCRAPDNGRMGRVGCSGTGRLLSLSRLRVGRLTRSRPLESALNPAVRAAYHSQDLGGLLRAVQGHGSGAAFFSVVRAARFDQSVEVNAETAAAMTQRFTWLLSRVSDEGIKLTAAGYLPPLHVEAAMTQLAMHEEWIGKGNREDLTLPVLELREAAQQLELLRKYRGRLLLTKQAQRLRDDPLALWWHITGRLPQHKPGSSEFQAGLVTLVLVAAGHDVRSSEHRRLVTDVLTDLGWRRTTGEPLSEHGGYAAARETVSLLEDLCVFGPRTGRVRVSTPSPQGQMFARVALSTSAEGLDALRPHRVAQAQERLASWSTSA